MTQAVQRRRVAWALALVSAVVALGVHLTSQIGRNGCIRHGSEAVAAHDAELPAIEAASAGEAAHAACPVCAAPTAGVSVLPLVAAPGPAPAAVPLAPAVAIVAPCVDEAPLDYAPKTSPPVA